MRKKKLTILSAVILLVIVFIILRPGSYSPMTGTVVDAVTGNPIEGAVVLVEWTKTHGIGEHWTESFKVEEAVTDRDGKFSVAGLDAWNVNRPDVTVYKKGYVVWSNRWIFPGYEKRKEFRWGDYVFKLEHFKGEYSYISHVTFISLSINESINSKSKGTIQKAFGWESKMANMEREQQGR